MPASLTLLGAIGRAQGADFLQEAATPCSLEPPLQRFDLCTRKLKGQDSQKSHKDVKFHPVEVKPPLNRSAPKVAWLLLSLT